MADRFVIEDDTESRYTIEEPLPAPTRTILPRRTLSEYDVNAPGVQRAQDVTMAPRREQPVRQYQQPDLVTAFESQGRPTMAPVQPEAGDILATAPQLPARPRGPLGKAKATIEEQFSAGMASRRNPLNRQREVMGVDPLPMPTERQTGETVYNTIVPAPAMGVQSMGESAGGIMRQAGDYTGWDALEQAGTEIADLFQQRRQATAEQYPLDDPTAEAIRGGISSFVQMLGPGTLGALRAGKALKAGATATQAAKVAGRMTLLPMAGMTEGAAYDKYRDQGHGVASSTAGAGTEAVVEYWTEKLGTGPLMGYLTAAGKQGIRAFLEMGAKAGVGDQFGEQLATHMQTLTEKVMGLPGDSETDKRAAVSDYFTVQGEDGLTEFQRNARDTAVSTLTMNVLGPVAAAGGRRLTQRGESNRDPITRGMEFAAPSIPGTDPARVAKLQQIMDEDTPEAQAARVAARQERDADGGQDAGESRWVIEDDVDQGVPEQAQDQLQTQDQTVQEEDQDGEETEVPGQEGVEPVQGVAAGGTAIGEEPPGAPVDGEVLPGAARSAVGAEGTGTAGEAGAGMGPAETGGRPELPDQPAATEAAAAPGVPAQTDDAGDVETRTGDNLTVTAATGGGPASEPDRTPDAATAAQVDGGVENVTGPVTLAATLEATPEPAKSLQTSAGPASASDTTSDTNPLAEAFQFWREGKAYIDGAGNYHIKAEGRSSGPIAPWNKAAKAKYKTPGEFHRAAHDESAQTAPPMQASAAKAEPDQPVPDSQGPQGADPTATRRAILTRLANPKRQKDRLVQTLAAEYGKDEINALVKQGMVRFPGQGKAEITKAGQEWLVKNPEPPKVKAKRTAPKTEKSELKKMDATLDQDGGEGLPTREEIRAALGETGLEKPTNATVPDTPAEVVKEAVKTAKQEGTPLKEQKKYLVANIDEAIKSAPNQSNNDIGLLRGELNELRSAFTEADGRKAEAASKLNLWKNPELFKDITPERRQEMVNTLQNAVDVADADKRRINPQIKAAQQALRDADAYVTIDVPDDGTFEVYNTKAALKAFKVQVEKLFPSAEAKGGKQGYGNTPKPTGAKAEGLEDGFQMPTKEGLWHGNGHVMLKGKEQVPFKGAPSSRFADRTPEENQDAINRIKPKHTAGKPVTETVFVAFGKGENKTDNAKFEATSTEPIKLGKDETGYARLYDAEGKTADVDQKYYVYAKQHFPNAKIRINGPDTPVTFIEGGEVVAIVMPMRQGVKGGVLDRVIAARQSQFDLADAPTTLSPSAITRIESLIAQALPPGKVTVNLVPSITPPPGSAAAFAAHGVKSGKVAGMTERNITSGEVRSIITLAMDGATDRTGYHEVLHAAEALGVISRGDMKILERAYPDKDGVASSERRADAFADYVADQTAHPMARSIFARVSAFLKRLAKALRGEGWRTADDVFSDLMGGRLKGGEQRSAGVQFSATGPRKPFFSKLAEVVNNKMGGRMPVAQLIPMLKANGVSDAEIDTAIGAIRDEGGTATKQQVMDEIRANSVEFEDVVLGNQVKSEDTYKNAIAAIKRQDNLGYDYATQALGDVVNEDKYSDSGSSWRDVWEVDNEEDARLIQAYVDQERNNRPTHFEQYVEPGAVEGSYREMFVTAPMKGKGTAAVSAEVQEAAIDEIAERYNFEDGFYAISKDDGSIIFMEPTRAKFNSMVDGELGDIDGTAVFLVEEGEFVGIEDVKEGWRDGHSQYSSIGNPVVRIRFNERNADGKRVLFVEEMQGPSDANQKKMPDYLRKRIYDIGVKRVLAYAKENGFDGVAWTTGAMQAARYDLSKTVEKIEYQKNGDGTYDITAVLDSDHDDIQESGLTPAKMVETIGKEATDKILSGEHKEGEFSDGSEYGTLENADLKIGGEGLTSLYDRTLPALFKKYGKEGVSTVTFGREVFTDGVQLDDDLNPITTGRQTETVGTMKVPFTPITDRTPGSYPQFSLARAYRGRNPRALRSALTVHPYIQGLASWVMADGRNVTRWQRSVGTMYHTAEDLAAKGMPQFREVFRKGQEFLNDVSALAVEAESLAPDIFPKLGSGKGVFRNLSKRDAMAISAPLYDGTLRGGADPTRGKVWNDVELESLYHLTAEQIKLYRQARAAVDQSLEDVAKSLVAKNAKTVSVGFDREMSLTDMAADVTLAIQERTDDLQAELDRYEDGFKRTSAGVQGTELKRLEKARDTFVRAQQAAIDLHNGAMKNISDLAKKTESLKKHGYFPLMRFGEYTVTVKDRHGETQFFGMYETSFSARLAYERAKRDNPGMVVTRGGVNKEKHKLYAGMNIEALQLFADHLGADETAPYQEYLKEAMHNRSALKRLIHRKGTEGYNEDAVRTLASFIVSNARHASTQYHLHDMAKMIQDIPEGSQWDVQAKATRLYEYLTKPAEEASKLRGYLFFHYLGGSLASGIVNMTQPVMMTAPYLATKANPAKVTAELAKAAKDSFTDPGMVGGPLGIALRRAEREGITAPQEIHQLTAVASNKLFASSGAVNAAMKAWGGFFAAAEVFNRRTTFIAAFRIAKDNGAANGAAYTEAAEAVTATQGIYNKGNRPEWARGIVGAPIFTFKQFGVMYLELFNRLPVQQKVIMMGLLILMAGLEGLPFREDAEDIIDTIGQWMGHSTNTNRYVNDLARRTMGEPAADFALRGVSSVLPFDLQGRMGMHNLIPGTAFFKPSDTDKGREFKEFFGPMGGLFTSLTDALGLLVSGLPGRAAIAAAPRSVQNVAQGAEMAATGAGHDKYGRKTVEVDRMEALTKAIGFNPSRVAAESRMKSAHMQDMSLLRVRKQEIVNQWAYGIVHGDKGEVAAAREKLKQWNAKNPEWVIAGDGLDKSIENKVRALRDTSKGRFLKSVPKPQRRRVSDEME